MLSRISKLFGYKQKPVYDVAAKPILKQPQDQRFKNVKYGSLVLTQIKDQDTLNTLNEKEIADMLTNWKLDLRDLESSKDVFKHFLVDLKTLNSFNNVDNKILGPISNISYVINSDEHERNLNMAIDNPHGLSGLNVNIQRDEQTSDYSYSTSLNIEYKNKIVLKMRIVDNYDVFTEIEHFLPGEWLTQFMPFIETNFAQDISDFAENKNKTSLELNIQQYQRWANSFLGNKLYVNNMNIPVPQISSDSEEKSTDYNEIRIAWYEQFKDAFNGDFEPFDLSSIINCSDNQDISKMISSLNFDSISTFVSDKDINIKNPLSNTGLSLIYKIDNDSCFHNKKFEVLYKGEKVLCLSNDYKNLIIDKITPGPWMVPLSTILTSDLPKIKGIADNLNVIGDSIDNRTLVSSVFEI